MNEEHLGQLQQVLNDLEEGLRMRQQDKARIVELENCIKGLIFSDIIRNDGDFITMRGIAINNLDRACKAIGATIDLDALCTAQLSACVIGGTGISSSMRGALAEAGQQPSVGVVDERAALENLAKDYERRAEGPCPGWVWAADVARDIRARLNQPTAGDGVLCALMSALEGVVHDQRVPNEVSQECAAVLIEARRLNPCRAQAVPDLGQAATDVLAERKRQITEEGWTPEHDDHHTYGEIADAAACYALWGGGSSPHNFDQFWPWDRSWLKFGQARQMLVKAGALILAEIERLDRAAPSTKKESE